MGRIEELLTGASKDLELAKRYKDMGEHTIALLLYTEATEKIFGALFMRRTGKQPPAGASAEYLAIDLDIPKDVFDDAAMRYAESVRQAETTAVMSVKERALHMDGAVKRLLDYSMACVWM